MDTGQYVPGPGVGGRWVQHLVHLRNHDHLQPGLGPRTLHHGPDQTGAVQHPGHGLVRGGLPTLGHQLRGQEVHRQPGQGVLPFPQGKYLITFF